MDARALKSNNFDLIRLLAAGQVVLHHCMEHYLPQGAAQLPAALAWFIRYFPGVPVFFFISGFLISRSYKQSRSPRDYAVRRVLRIYPALIACCLFGVLLAYGSGYLPRPGGELWRVLVWLGAQTTMVQFYNPEFMRGFGVGVMNGSLWTICVELQFYLIIPVMYRLLGGRAQPRLLPLALAIVVFCALNQGYWLLSPDHTTSIGVKLLGVTFIPWIYMFLVGVAVQECFDRLPEVSPKLCIGAGLLYFGLAYVARTQWGLGTSNDISPLVYPFLIAFIVCLAFSWPQLSARLLKSNDISYGLYLFHMPVLNLLLYVRPERDLQGMLIITLSSALLAALSWRFIEKPALGLKQRLMSLGQQTAG